MSLLTDPVFWILYDAFLVSVLVAPWFRHPRSATSQCKMAWDRNVKKVFAVLFLLVASLAVAQEPEAKRDPKVLVQEGVALFDAGKYDDAIAKYNQALASDPQNQAARYELALAFTSKSDFKKCRETLEPVIAIRSAQSGMIYNAYANCLDASGERVRAIAVYRQGLLISPDEPQLQYNLAISLLAKNKPTEAREARGLLERELVSRPAHASGHYALARLFQAQHFSVPAIFEYLRFLTLEPSTPRSKTSAAAAIALMNGFVKVEGKDVKITLDPSRGDEGDFGVAEMMLGLSGAAAQMAEESKSKLEIETLAEQLDVIVSMLTESSEPRQNFTAQTNLPFFGAMRDKNLIEPFVYVGFSSLDLPGTRDWIARNKRRVEAYQRWVEANGREKPIPVPQ